MQNNTRIWLALGSIGVLIVIASIFLLLPHTAFGPTNAATNTAATTTTVDLGGGVSAQLPTGVTISQVSSAQAPDLNHQVVYSADLSADTVSALKTQIASATAALKKDPSDGGSWLQLGVDYKIAGDYTAAKNVWVYLTLVSPGSYIAFGNLGDLYQNFLHDYPNAEANYLQAIKLNPQGIDFYSDLYTLYRYQYKTNTSAAADILTQGLKANPNNAELLQLQAQMQSGN